MTVRSAALAGAAAVAVALAPPAQAETFIMCPSGRSGVATNVTSCAFADSVRASYLAQGGPVITAYSPVTGMSYAMQCQGGFFAAMNNGVVVDSIRCAGGNNAVVVAW